MASKKYSNNFANYFYYNQVFMSFSKARPPDWVVVTLQLEKGAVAHFKALLEAYDGLASLTVRKGGICDIYVHDSQRAALDDFIAAYVADYV